MSKFFSLPSIKQSNLAVGEAKSLALAKCSTVKARSIISYELAIKLKVLPIAYFEIGNTPTLSLASFIINMEIKELLKFHTSCEIRLVEISEETLLPAIFSAYHGSEEGLLKNFKELQLVNSDKQEDLNDNAAQGEAAIFLDTLIKYCIAQQASDLHLVPELKGCSIRVRISGQCLVHDDQKISKALFARIVSRLKVLCSLDITKHACPQEGAFRTAIVDGFVNIRTSFVPTVLGERVVLRFLMRHEKYALSDLGYNLDIQGMIKQSSQREGGLIVFSGATGSGKTTSLYALMSELAAQNLTVISIEDPVESLVNGVSQCSLNVNQGLDYEVCLKSLLRQDPDVIMLGEIRDASSANLAIQASLTGHLVLTTIHAGNVFEILERLEIYNISRENILHLGNLFLHQSLRSILCNCKVLDLNNTKNVAYKRYRPVGCSECNYTGYQKQKMFCEALMISTRIRQLCLENEHLRIEQNKLKKSEYVNPAAEINLAVQAGLIISD